MKHDYKGTLKRLEKAHSWHDGVTIQEAKAILHALSLADKLTGEPSEKMVFEGSCAVDCGYYPSTGNYSCEVTPIFKAMVAQAELELEKE